MIQKGAVSNTNSIVNALIDAISAYKRSLDEIRAVRKAG